VKAARNLVESAGNLGVRNLTLYTFSSDNWKRPAEEVGALLRLFERSLPAEAESCVANGIRLHVIGRRDRLPGKLADTIERAEKKTANCDRMVVRLAVDYSGRESLVAVARSADRDASRDAFVRHLASAYHSDPVPDVDLLIRTGGEQRLSDFLLWESAYAEIYFQQVLFPDYTTSDLEEALIWYGSRERRFGATPRNLPRRQAPHPKTGKLGMLNRDTNSTPY
jgi:undecaprenyl diphosphate synthase